MIATAKVAHAMALQVDRVNARRMALPESDMLEKMIDLEDEVARLRKRIAELELLLEAYDVTTGTQDAQRGPSYDQRPTITAVEAAQRAGVSLATVTRYVKGGWWDGIPPRRGHNRLLVYSDQPLTSKATKKRRKGYAK